MITPASFDESITPYIIIGGVKYPVPELVPRQLRHIRSALFELNSRLGNGVSDAFSSLSDEEYDRLLLGPVYWGMTRAHPELQKDQFLDMRWEDTELISAWFVIRKQSGLFVFEEKSPTGEAQAADQTQSGTGTN